MYQFKVIKPTQEVWEKDIEKSNDSTVFHSREWNKYLKRIGHRPIIISVSNSERDLGYFLGEKFLYGRFISMVCSSLCRVVQISSVAQLCLTLVIL